MADFKDEVKLTQNKLKLDDDEAEEYKEWEERYAKYIGLMVKHKKNALESFDKFYSVPQFQYYLTIGDLKGTVNDFHFSVRYMGQEVATIVSKLTNGKIFITADEKKNEKNKSAFGTDVPELSNETTWDSDEAKKFRKFFENSPAYNGAIGEHRLENELYTALIKGENGAPKLLKGIQPIKLANSLRFPLTTPLSASGDEVNYATVGGGIDILASCRNKLTVIELKKEYQSPEIVMKQALRYATFLHTLLRSEKEIPSDNSKNAPKISGEEWYKFLKTTEENEGNPPFPEGLIINVVVAMPKNPYGFSDKSFAYDVINLGKGDKLVLHYMYLTVDEAFKITEIDSSLNKTEEEKQEILKIKEIQKAELAKQKENSVLAVTVHRGTDQIGGTVTEIKSKKGRIFIDFGSQLSGTKEKTEVNIEGLTHGKGDCTLLLSHYHGDHIGEIHRVLSDVPVYFGELATEISTILSKTLLNIRDTEIQVEQNDKLKVFQRAKKLETGKSFPVEDMKVTPYRVDHSAFDSYMFLIECEGIRLLHTGDFRMHGYQCEEMRALLNKIGKIDYLISEGTTVGRAVIETKSQGEYQKELSNLLQKPKVAILCSSTNIDHLASVFQALPPEKIVLCDEYQKKILECVSDFQQKPEYHLHERYCFPVERIKLIDKTVENSDNYCVLIRPAKVFSEFSKKKFDFLTNPEKNQDIHLIYSQWTGYLNNGSHPDTNIVNLEKLFQNRMTKLHTSGHVSKADLKEVGEILKPKGVIPIHTDDQEGFKDIFDENVLIPSIDGETYHLK